jgi:hypothetical protein
MRQFLFILCCFFSPTIAKENAIGSNEFKPFQYVCCFYFNDIGLIFFNIPKCASSFIRTSISLEDEFTKHTRINYFNIPDKIKETASTLLVVRNPYERAISSYLEVIKARSDGPREVTLKKSFFLERKNVCNSFTSYLLDIIENGFYDAHQLCQFKFIKDKKINLSDVSFIIDFEHFDKDLELFYKYLNSRKTTGKIVASNKNVHTNIGNPSKKKILNRYIANSPTTRKLIEEIYKDDFHFYSKCKERRKQILENLNY